MKSSFTKEVLEFIMPPKFKMPMIELTLESIWRHT